MADTFLFSDYWPKPTVGNLVKIDYGITAGQRLRSIFSNSGDNKIWHQDDYTDDKWTATWINNYFYIDDNGKQKGIVEIADWYPARNWLQNIFSPISVTTFYKGYEIPWGGVQKVGDVIDAKLWINPLKSSFPTWGSTGRQVVKFVKRYFTFKTVDKKQTYTDVVEITYDQTFGDKTAGARYWYAKGIGIVQMQWRGFGQDVGDILPCTVTYHKGFINKQRYPVYI